MMNQNINKIINSNRGKIVFSIILGFGLATLFRKACNSRNCLLFKAPPIEKIKGKIFGFNNKCYKYNERSTSCKSTPQIKTLEVYTKN